MNITSEQQLRELYGFPKGRAKDKVLSSLEKHAINFIANSPFVLISTSSHSGTLDCSPRGGTPGFTKVIDQQTLVIPDAKGNNRLDSLVNIVETGQLGCLFLIPGIDETLRINGTAQLTTNMDYLALFSEERNPPKVCIEIKVQEVFLHCAKALMRSRLWDIDGQIERSSFPTMSRMLNEQLGQDAPLETQQEMVQRYKPDL